MEFALKGQKSFFSKNRKKNENRIVAHTLYYERKFPKCTRVTRNSILNYIPYHIDTSHHRVSLSIILQFLSMSTTSQQYINWTSALTEKLLACMITTGCH